MSDIQLSTVTLHYDYDVVAARRRARQIATLLGFDEQEQTRLATVTSEIARNALRYGGGGTVELALGERAGAQSLVISVVDRGPGIANLDNVLNGRFQSTTGMGLGIAGARRLMDDFAIDSAPGRGTSVTMRKELPPGRRFSQEDVARVAADVASHRPESPIEELQQQNGELLRALAEVSERQRELERLNQELEDTNRGVLALYAELDEKADHLRHADQLKTRFLSDMSHEFRTPVNSILALGRLLQESELDAEQRKQVSLIGRAAEDLASLVNDLLDLAKIEAGKVDVRPTEIEVANLFSALRGMLRPLLPNRDVTLTFDEPDGLPLMMTDEAKLSQILRNFISNALKFTEAGEVRVSAQLTGDGEFVRFCVTDSGIGIAPDDVDRIFEEFTQIESPLQRAAKGTGLGLPLTRKLARLLGGGVGVKSAPGSGSTFWVEIPVRYVAHEAAGRAGRMPPMSDVQGGDIRSLKILIIDDDETARYTLGSFAMRPGAKIVEADNGMSGLARAVSEQPDLILLDLMMPGIGGHEVLARLKSETTTSDIPVIVVTSRFINDDERDQILSRAIAVINKGDLSRDVVMKAVDDALAAA